MALLTLRCHWYLVAAWRLEGGLCHVQWVLLGGEGVAPSPRICCGTPMTAPPEAMMLGGMAYWALVALAWCNSQHGDARIALWKSSMVCSTCGATRGGSTMRWIALWHRRACSRDAEHQLRTRSSNEQWWARLRSRPSISVLAGSADDRQAVAVVFVVSRRGACGGGDVSASHEFTLDVGSRAGRVWAVHRPPGA